MPRTYSCQSAPVEQVAPAGHAQRHDDRQHGQASRRCHRDRAAGEKAVEDQAAEQHHPAVREVEHARRFVDYDDTEGD
jgi:hypothetical protein